MPVAVKLHPEDVVAVPARVAACIADISERRLGYWAQQGVAVPSVAHLAAEGARGRVRLYDFTELMSLLIAAELRDRDVSLQHIRRVVEHLRVRGYKRPLIDVRFATVGGELYFQHSDGTWEGGLRPDQIVIHEVLRLEPLRMRILEGLQRSNESQGRVERRRGTVGSKPVVHGTRLPTDTVRRYLAAGRTPEQIVAAYPFLSEADIQAVAAAV